MHNSKLTKIFLFVIVFTLLGNYVVLSSAEGSGSSIDEQVTSGNAQTSSGNASGDISQYEYKEDVQEGSILEIPLGMGGVYVRSTLSEDYISTMKESSLKEELLNKGIKYIDKNSKKYRHCILLISSDDDEISDLFLLNQFTVFQKQQDVTNNTYTLSNDVLRFDFNICDNIECKLKSIEVIDSEYCWFDGEIRSNGLIDFVNRKVIFTYEQTKSDCWVEIDRFFITSSQTQQTSPKSAIIVTPDIIIPPAATTEAPRDKTKPIVKGVKNKKIYKKAIIIKFSDKQSGIKKATLNGKKIKNGKKVKKNGKYTLKVYDKAGNCTTVKFTVKIKKKK